MTLIAYTYDIQPGQLEDITQVMANFNTVKAVVNGGLENENVKAGAAIDYTKLSLTGKIVDADVKSTAAINPSKLKDYPSDVTKALRGNGTWGAGSGRMDKKTITAPVSITHTSEGTADTVIAGNSVTYDNTEVKITFWCPHVSAAAATTPITLVLLRDATVVGQCQLTGDNRADVPGVMIAYDTPSAAAHTYTVKAFTASGTATIVAGAGGSGNMLPAFLEVTRA